MAVKTMTIYTCERCGEDTLLTDKTDNNILDTLGVHGYLEDNKYFNQERRELCRGCREGIFIKLRDALNS